MLKQARRSMHDTTRHDTTSTTHLAYRVVTCRDVTQQSEFGLYPARSAFFFHEALLLPPDSDRLLRLILRIWGRSRSDESELEFGWPMSSDLRPIYGWQMTTLRINCPLWVSQHGRMTSNPCISMDCVRLRICTAVWLQAKSVLGGLGCGLGWTPALSVTHRVSFLAYAVIALYAC